MEILFIIENSWFNYIGNQRKSSKNETPYKQFNINSIFLLSFHLLLIINIHTESMPTHTHDFILRMTESYPRDNKGALFTGDSNLV